ncbi:MAG: 30S ribosomal protein S4 [Nanoarchaeota archaeon]
MIRKKKKYEKPRKMYETSRIEEENELVKKYGLKNKREIWKTISKVRYYRHRAMDLARAPLEEQEVLLNKLKSIGLNVNDITDVLALKVEDLLNRRLTSVVHSKKLANSTKHARQLVVHKKIVVNGRIVNSPSYFVPVMFESKIEVKTKVNKPKIENKEESEDSEETI